MCPTAYFTAPDCTAQHVLSPALLLKAWLTVTHTAREQGAGSREKGEGRREKGQGAGVGEESSKEQGAGLGLGLCILTVVAARLC